MGMGRGGGALSFVSSERRLRLSRAYRRWMLAYCLSGLSLPCATLGSYTCL